MDFLRSSISGDLLCISIPSAMGVVQAVISYPFTLTLQILHAPLGFTPGILHNVGI